ncbi:hypothetical protein [Actinoplanes utahensis]|uniref:Uncharacterized protein n=1 Tax=Actinoplanes utahensis TaxID=1869 RepID=A0A0A6UFN5_ACTUT|nr:hypothetical protein [Actinoplanes utahensis]KHD74830.1 hypothetical protein MB27_26150 [Actinoplanes utahensis]GIF30810.1 hypothetical protein Aut01nite_37960 [Actinoplanes utahensis]
MIGDDGGMGCYLHITRAFRDHESERFPILDEEVTAAVDAAPDLFTPPDAPRHPGFRYVMWKDSVHEEYLLFQRGQLDTKHPSDAFIRRMIELAGHFDAWVIGDDAEVYEWDGAQIVAGDRDREEFHRRQLVITRASMNGDAPIRWNEWTALAAAQPDFSSMSSVEVRLPSGLRWIECPPVHCWTGHPSGRPVPFFHDEDLIEVTDADEATERRMTELAAALQARVVEG